MPSDFRLNIGKQERAVAASQILRDRRLQPLADQQPRHGSSLVMTNFDCGKTVLAEQMRQLGSQRAIRVETLTAREQCLIRLIFPNAWAKFGAFRDIGWIAQDQVESPVQPLAPIARLEHRLAPGIAPREGERFGRGIDAEADRIGPLIERGEKQGAGSGAEIEDRRRPCSMIQTRDRSDCSPLPAAGP